MSGAWLALLSHAPAARVSGRNPDAERLKAMLRVLEAGYSRPVSLEDVAAAACVSPREANRCFRRQLNMTPFEYLLNYRVDRACELLRATALPVTEIALRCGFGTASYFGKLFRARMGSSPTAYRRAHAGASGGC